MKSLLASFVAICMFPLPVLGDYATTSFVELAGTSEKIAVGTIVKVDKDTFALKVEDLIVGSGRAGDTITVRRFHDWPCAWRWSVYEKGQKVLVFLNSNKEAGAWDIRGAGCEGESPVVKKAVYANFFVPGRAVKFGKDRFGRSHQLNEVPYDQLRSAIVDFRATFRVTPAENPWRKDGKYSVYVPFDRIDRIVKRPIGPFRPRRPPPKFKDRSPLHRHLSEVVEKERGKMAKYKTR